ncbi:MAG: aldehyde dehydrogenase family protein, partial [Gammaproteobacteria bacterium]|nr:aldehyde dehydrogenase family protein [Gammaproteobacteria bacterium]
MSTNPRIANAGTAPSMIGHYINGKLHDSGRHLEVSNPATGQVCKRVALASQETVGAAVAAAAEAFVAWRDTPPGKRARVLFNFKQLLEDHAEELAALLTEEHG